MSKLAFQGFLHTGLPDFDALYGIRPLLFKRWDSYAGWSDNTEEPTSAWFDNLAASYTNAHNYILIDQENWPWATQGDRLATVDKYIRLYQGIKSRRPDLQVGVYGVNTPIKDYFRAVGLSAGYTDWQAENEDFAAMYAVMDYFAPSIYYFYNRAADGGASATTHAHEYFHQQILEVTRLRTAYGHGQPIYPYVWYKKSDDSALLDLDVWGDMTETAYTEADGLILWGGNAEAWDEFAPWWINFKAAWPYGDRTVMKPRSPRV